jgi:hypothetical protein
VSLTGVIYGGIVVLWLCYLVPLALRRYDHAAKARSVERFSTAMRVLGGGDPDVPVAVDPPRGAHAAPAAPVSSRPITAASRRAAAKAAVRRRRRVLAMLGLLTVATTVLCVLGVAPWWVVAVPVTLVVVFLALAHRQVARSRAAIAAAVAAEHAAGSRAAVSTAATATSRGAVPTAAVPTAAVPTAAVPTAAVPTAAVPTAAVPTAAVPTAATPTAPELTPATTGPLAAAAPAQELSWSVTADPVRPAVQSPPPASAGQPTNGSLWDPLPVTLPTYVTKPRATRSVRTVDLGTSSQPSTASGATSAAGTAERAPASARAVGD